MKSLLYFRTLLLMACCLLMVQQAAATHIRAGEITARRLDPQSFEYEITLRGYADTGSRVIFGSNGTLDFGDGTIRRLTNNNDPADTENYIPRFPIGNDTWLYELKVRHTFPSARSYTISFKEDFRNEGILNMDNSVNMPFYIETVIIIDPFLGVNNTPELLVPPVDKAAVGKVYIHNPGAYDVDGDSISYRLVVSRQDANTPVANYRYPHQTFPAGDPRNGTNLQEGPPQFTLDPLTGDLVWNTPGTEGEYNVAFYIEEWRRVQGQVYLLGYVTRDMQIIVEDTDNEPPLIEPPLDLCVVAGEVINEKIRVSDPDGDLVEFNAYSGVFGMGATLTPQSPRSPTDPGIETPFEADFSWQTECADIRQQPYQVVFRASDVRGSNQVRLSDIKTWNIKVVAPQPQISSLEAQNRSVVLGFDPGSYACATQANGVQVWRREGSIAIPIDTCITGMPAGYGYEQVGIRGLDAFPFTDGGGNGGLKPGATYCYRLVVQFPLPGGGESLVSEERCVTMPAKMPLITQVSVLETDETAGAIQVAWMPGPDMTVGEVAQPYRYDLYRAEGYGGGSYTLIASDLTAEEYRDASGLDTQNRPYNYKVVLKDAQGVVFDSSSTASSVRIEPTPGVSSIQLSWQAQVPWSNAVAEYPIHRLYRNNVDPADPEKFELIAEVNVLQGGFSYTDTGSNLAGEAPLSEDLEYCYYVVTSGSYNNPAVPEPLLNNSQKVCSGLKDEIPPCPPLEFALKDLRSCEEMIEQTSCGDVYTNTLSWDANTDAVCGDDFAYWLVSYSPDGESFEAIAEIDTRVDGLWQYSHELEGTMAGFYYIQAVDRSGNLSEPSNTVMRDNCPNYWLPNIITRDDAPGDENNDRLRPPYAEEIAGRPELNYRCPRFVESVVFKVYNRWGKQVYEYNSASAPEPDIYIRWDGRTSSGEPVTNGTYYYVVEVTYYVFDPAKRNRSLKGWVYVGDETQNQ